MKEFEFSLPISKPADDETLAQAAAKAMGIARKHVDTVTVIRKSLDARNDILYRYRCVANRCGEPRPDTYSLPQYTDVSNAPEVIIAGSGPAGMFAALRLLMEGFRPVILERGKDVHGRKYDQARIATEGIVNPDSNYCFGEGGAGTFSDGKLYTRSSKRGDIREVLTQLVRFGAKQEILTDAHPHIGSDKLPEIVENIRKCIISHGGEYHFNSRVTDLSKEGGLWTVTCADGNTYSARNVILATGHSARDIYRMFTAKGWELEAKGFALGVRVEHPQSLINRIQYHGKYQPYMPAAEYSFVQQIETGGDSRGVFSFCMCPGGLLVPAATAPEELVLNGMSNSQRNSKWANAGVVVSIEPQDVLEHYPQYAQYGALSVMYFQQDVERKMFEYSSSLKAPAQRMMDFCRRKLSDDLPKSSYFAGVVNAPLHELLPQFVYARLREAFPKINYKMKGYYTNDALLLGVESRTSSPVRIPRDPVTLQHISQQGLYPAGEGAGYAGGIVSSALDGIRCAMRIAGKED